MDTARRFHSSIFGASLRPQSATLVILIMLLFFLLVLFLVTLMPQPAQAQTFKVIYNFTNGQDGASPDAGLTMDRAGNLYGTASAGGSDHDGTVYRLKRSGSNWVFNTLYSFVGGGDGVAPRSRLIFGPNGSLYGTTTYGGGSTACPTGCGTVFSLRPPASDCKTASCDWQETVLYRFMGGNDGAHPNLAELILDGMGNLYGTTPDGGGSGCRDCGEGTVYKLTPSNGGWTERVLHSFTGGADGGLPAAGVIFDQVGNLYGTTDYGGNLACNPGYGCGTVFQLTPSGSGWMEKVLYTFQGASDGASPLGGLIFDSLGNLYGSTSYNAFDFLGGGTVFELTPSNGGWTLTTLHSFTGFGGSEDSLIMDTAGNLYGTTVLDGAYGNGSVFKLTPSGKGWAYTDLHDFTGGSDGAVPFSGVTLDADGNLYGTAALGGANGDGVVWEITP